MFALPTVVYIGALCAGMAIPVLWWSVSTSSSSTPAMRDRLQVDAPKNLRQIVLSRNATERVVEPGITRFADWARQISPVGFVERLERKIALAGVGREWPLQRVLSTKFILGAAFAVLFLLRWATDPSNARLLFAGVLTAVGMFVLPDLLIGIRAQKRQEAIALDLPNVLDQITISVEAGLGFEAAIAHVVDHIDSPLGDELGHALQDIRVGMSRDQAFDNLASRTDVQELRQFIVSLQQAERLGVPIARVLRIQSAELRTIRRQRAEENAQKLPVKMIIPLVLFILPALIIVVIAPAVFDAMDAFG